MTKSTPHNTGDIRCKGTKSDDDLAREWINDDNLFWHYSPPSLAKSVCEHKQAIEKELGKDRLEFLVFKIKMEERLRGIEENKYNGPAFANIVNWSCDRKPWYKRLGEWVKRTEILKVLLAAYCLVISAIFISFLVIKVINTF